MSDYSFTTVWRIHAPVERVFDALRGSTRWPYWWVYVESVVELEPGDAEGLGSLRRYTWSTPLGYTLRFDMRTTRLERPHLIEGRARGELEGRGCWQLTEAGGVTEVRYDWQVRTTKWWMRALAPLARPLFAWNHDRVMKAGGKGLARLLEAEPERPSGPNPQPA